MHLAFNATCPRCLRPLVDSRAGLSCAPSDTYPSISPPFSPRDHRFLSKGLSPHVAEQERERRLPGELAGARLIRTYLIESVHVPLSLSLSKSHPAGLLEDIGTLANEDRRGDSQGQRRAVGDVVVGTEDFSPAASR